MKSLAAMTVASAALTLAGLVGCGKKADDISTPEYLLARQHKMWKAARQSLQSERPNLRLLLSVHTVLCYRTPRRIEKAYGGSDKAD
ncbi:unnamed protein product, partial [marine sediment metagenome]